MSEVTKFVRENLVYTISMIGLLVLCVYVLLFRPHLGGLEALKSTFFLFGLSLDTVILLWGIGLFLMYRWYYTGMKSASTLSWGLSFLVYSLVFIGLCLQALGVGWANSNDPVIFFAFRNVMILWAAGMWLGISSILTEKKIIRFGLSGLIIVASYIWFAYGLLILGDVEYTMYGFLFAVWIPICITVGYAFYLYGSNTGLSSPKFLTVGFIFLAITYMAWAPWHFPDVSYIYFIWFFLFEISLVPILIGFILLPYQVLLKKSAD
ncbi:MAG: hypothetical protein ACFFCD_00480 [Promethearchaeota archaeon]